MWSRTLTKAMGIDAKDFAKALSAALGNEGIQKKLQSILHESIKMDFDIINDKHDSLSKDMDKLKETNDELNNHLANLRMEIQAKNDTITSLEKKVEELEIKQDAQEQYSRRNSLRISGIPELVGENTPTMVVQKLNEILKLDPPLMEAELDRVHRVGPKTQQPRAILIKFATYDPRFRVYKSRTKLKPRTERSEGDDEIVSPVEPPVYINEDLTRRRTGLLYLARQRKKHETINDCWTYDGHVVVKDTVNTIHQINSAAELDAII